MALSGHHHNEQHSSINESYCVVCVARIDESARLRAEVARLTQACDANMLLLKACDEIAEGTEGWEKLRNECVSTQSVAALRERAERAESRCRELEEELARWRAGT